jgi:hypothetical protein
MTISLSSGSPRTGASYLGGAAIVYCKYILGFILKKVRESRGNFNHWIQFLQEMKSDTSHVIILIIISYLLIPGCSLLPQVDDDS